MFFPISCLVFLNSSMFIRLYVDFLFWCKISPSVSTLKISAKFELSSVIILHLVYFVYASEAFLHSDLGHHTDIYWCGCMKLYLKYSKPVWLCFFCGTLKKIFCKSVGSQQHWTSVNYVKGNKIFPLTNKCYVTKTRRWRTKTNIWW